MLNQNRLMRNFRYAFVFFALLIFLLAHAEICYTVTPDLEKKQLRVSITIPTKGDHIELQIPQWSPGAYILADYFRNITDLSASDGSGGTLPVDRVNDTTWRVMPLRAKEVQVVYSVPAALTAWAIHYSGPSTYLYVVGRKEESCKLTLSVPEGWRVAVGLDEVRGQPNTYTAPDYDVLADNPVTMGDFLMDTYTVRGKPHYIVLRGTAKDQVDRAYLMKVCKHITEAQADFFGGLPYNKYVWHFNVFAGRGGGGGLEHLTSTQISLASGVGPRSVAVMAHEFFHLWNVKRIRSKPLGPFNYQELPRTGALWWLEGVTDYYADLLLFRYGWWDEKTFHDSILSNLNAMRRNPARLEVSPYEASWKVGEANNGRGNSNGWRISYYTAGWLVGLLLDTEIRYQSKGKHSLDDVMRALWAKCKGDKPGFEEDEIRKQCVRFGGESLGEFYDKIVMKPHDYPVEQQLAKVGLRLSNHEEAYSDTGFRYEVNFQAKAPRVTQVSGPAAESLKEGDLILAVNGTQLDGKTTPEMRDAMSTNVDKAQVGVPLKLQVQRGEEKLDVEITPTLKTRPVQKIEEAPDATEAQRAIRRGWYYAGKR